MPDANVVWSAVLTIALFIIGGVSRLIMKRQDGLEDKIDRSQKTLTRQHENLRSKIEGVDQHLSDTREDMKENYASRHDVREGFNRVYAKLDENRDTAAQVQTEVAKLTALIQGGQK